MRLIDVHVHYFPARVFEAIWHYFESESHGLWPIRYKVHGEAHLQTLRGFGVERCSTLVYAHKPGMADSLNDFVAESAAQHPELMPFGTVFAGDGDVARRTARLCDASFLGVKLHPFVSGEMLDDPRLFPAYEVLAASHKVVICHPGSGPVYQDRSGAQRLRRVLQQFPDLRIVIAHCGAFEFSDYEPLAREFEHVYFDTAMIGIRSDVFPDNSPPREFFVTWQDRMLFGSDFPNIPHAYEEQIHAIQALSLGEAVEEKIFRSNAQQLLRLETSRDEADGC
ncbi:MAG: amidohydrolase family protein [Candidatus Xenobia bacterium]